MQTKTILLTGAAGALGAALAMECARAGCHLILLDKERDALEQLYDRITADSRPEPALHPLDLSVAGTDDFEAMTAAIAAQFGGLDGVVHCAAHFQGLMPLDHVQPQEWLLSLQVNLNAAWLLSVHCLPMLRESPEAHLYFMLDDLSRVGGAFWGPYGVSKHALRALAKQFAAELATTSVQVLGIDPGPMRSALRARAYHAEHPEQQPTPAAAARKIVDYLARRLEPDGTLIEL